MKDRSKRWKAKNGAVLKRNRKNRAKRRETTAAVREAFRRKDEAAKPPSS